MVSSPARLASEASFHERRRRLLISGCLVAVLLVAAAMGLRALAYKKISIHVDGSEPLVLSTAAWRVSAALNHAGIQLAEGDLVSPALGSFLSEGDIIFVRRAFAVTIAADGQTHEIKTTGAAVHSLLEMVGITLGPDDKVSPKLGAYLDGPGAITVSRVKHEFSTTDEKIPFKTTRRPDPSMDMGQTRVTKKGQDGILRKTIKATLEDGKRVGATVVSTEVIKAPVDAVITVGSRPVPKVVQTTSGKYLQYTSTKELLATAYVPTGNPTYTGIPATRGVVAVDPKVIPLGTRLYIPGYGEAVAADTGGAIKGLRIDLCMETVREALQFGRRVVKVYILSSR